MGNPRGVARDFGALEQRRFRGIRWLEKGLSRSQVARRLGVAPTSVSRWARTLTEQGREGLKKAGRAGRKPRLSGEDLKRLEQGLLKGPEALGYETPLWTLWRVGHLIEQEFGVRYHKGHIWKILRQLKWSCQRPEGRARERNERPSSIGKGWSGRGLKKSPKRRAKDRLRRREWAEPTAASGTDVGAARADASAGVQLQL
jgi:transposase